MALPPILAPIAGDMQRVDALIRQRLDSDVVLIRQVAEHIVAGGGKRLRPALHLIAAAAAGFRGDARFELAAVIEFIHTATLLHDDVVDESDLRRGRETANAAFGNAASVLVGDFLYSRAFQMMVTVDNMRVMEVMAEATNTIAEGEVLQLLNVNDPQVDEARYLEVIHRKTAKLFEAAARLAGVMAGVSAGVEAGLAGYGRHLGTAFQLIDDVLDYSGDAGTIGKNVGDDLAEGKPTLPLIYAMRTGTPAQAELIRGAIVNGGRDEFAAIVAAIEATGALDYARNAARREADAARMAIQGLPESAAKATLMELAGYSVTRQN
ncbi:MAG: octaprenyl diphosphate synthase [Proteobacteria bacterium]|nr:octaprenyl diphosphate synthase [Pseudomonadota bacterium]